MKKYFKYLIIILLSLITIRYIDLNDVIDSLNIIDIKYTFLIVFLQTITLLTTSYQWFSIMKKIGIEVRYIEVLLINSSGNIVDFITPGVKVGGDFHRIKEMIKKFKINWELGISILTVQKLITSLSFLILFLISLNWIIKNNIKIKNITISINKIIIIIFLIISSIILMKKFKNNSKIIKYKSELKKNLKLINSKSNVLFLNLIIGMIIWLLYPFKLYILIRAFKYDINFFIVISITYITYLIGVLPLSVGGFGGFESSLIILLKMMNIPISISVLIAFLFKSLTILFEFFLSSFIILLSKLYRIYKKGDCFEKIKI